MRKSVDFVEVTIVVAILVLCWCSTRMCSDNAPEDQRCNRIANDELESGRPVLDVLDEHARCIRGMQ